MSHNDEEYDDSIMLSESLERIAAQAMHLKEKIEAGLQLPSWAEYKIYQAYDAVNKALGTAYPGRYEMRDKKASVFDLVKQAGGGAAAQPKERELIGHFKLPIYDGDPGAPGAKVVDYHMHPVFKNEHPGIIAGPGAEWVPLSTKKASVFDLVNYRRHAEAELGPLRHMTADEAERLRKSGVKLTTPPAHIQAAYWKELARRHDEQMGDKKASVFDLLRG